MTETEAYGTSMRGAFRKIEASTQTYAPRERFAVWRDVFHPRLTYGAQTIDVRRNFRGRINGHENAQGMRFGLVANQANTVQMGPDSSQCVIFSFTLAGGGNVSNGTDDTDVTVGSGMTILSGGRPLTVTTGDHTHLALSLPTEVLEALLGPQVATPESGFSILPDRGLVPFVREHLQRLHAHMGTMTEAEIAAAFDALLSMTTACLRQASAIGAGGSAVEVATDEALVLAARRHVERHFGERDLTAARIAEACGCSRSHLYRAFETCGDSIAGQVRRVRMESAAKLLSSDPTIAIDQVAHLCGFSDGSSFSRTFRGYHAVSPRQYRQGIR